MWTLLDQAFSSVTNFVLALLLARELPTRQVADTGILLGGVALVLVVQRALIVEPAFLDFGPAARNVKHAAIRRARRTSAYVAALAGLLFLAATPLVTSPTRSAALLLAILSPVVLAQDLGRYSSFLIEKPMIAVASDAVWVATMVAIALVAPMFRLRMSPTTLFAAWLVGAAAAAGVALGLLHAAMSKDVLYAGDVRLRPRWRLLGESMLTLVPTYGVPLMLIAAGGLSAAGNLRSGQVLISPLSPMVTAIGTVALVRATTRSMSYSRVKLLATVAAVVLIAGFVIYALVLFLAPEWAASVFGSADTRGRPLLPALVAYGALAAAATGPRTALRALRRVDRSFMAEFASCAATLVVSAPLVAVAGARGAALGLALGAAIGLGVWITVSGRAASGSYTTAAAVAPEAVTAAAASAADVDQL